MYSLILGEIIFEEENGAQYATIQKEELTLNYDTENEAEEAGEWGVSNGLYTSYLVPSMFNGFIKRQVNG